MRFSPLLKISKYFFNFFNFFSPLARGALKKKNEVICNIFLSSRGCYLMEMYYDTYSTEYGFPFV